MAMMTIEMSPALSEPPRQEETGKGFYLTLAKGVPTVERIPRAVCLTETGALRLSSAPVRFRARLDTLRALDLFFK